MTMVKSLPSLILHLIVDLSLLLKISKWSVHLLHQVGFAGVLTSRKQSRLSYSLAVSSQQGS